MKKLILIIALLIGLPLFAEELDNIQLPMRDYDGIELPAGAFIAVMSSQDISTQYCPEGYKVKFISVDDLFLHETIILPRGTIFHGYIEKINEPVIGTHASMKIKITKLVLPDNFEIPIKGYVYTSNNNLIGGGLTATAEYVKMPHYQQKFQGRFWSFRGPTLQVRPGARRRMGEHVRINSGDEELIILTSPAWITHTLTN